MSRVRHSIKDFQPGDTIEIGEEEYTFVARSQRPNKIFFEEGKQAIVAKVRGRDQKHFALKSFKKKFRNEAILEYCSVTVSTSEIPGMYAALIEAVDPNIPHYIDAISKYPFLQYAIIMPWLPHPTWSELRSRYSQGYSSLDYLTCRRQALNLAQLLKTLYARSIAHCDICPRNVLVGTEGKVFLIDFETVFTSSLNPPPWGYPTGQDGYRHHSVSNSPNGQWCLSGDLFSGALLIAELLTWHDPTVREQSKIETYIDQTQLHEINNEPYQALIKSLRRVSKDCADLFRLSWVSQDLETCPSMDVWVDALIGTPDTLPVLEKSGHVIVRRVKKTRRSGKKIDQTGRQPLAHTRQTSKNTLIKSRKPVPGRRNSRKTTSSFVSKHVARRVPTDERRLRRLQTKPEKTSRKVPTPTPVTRRSSTSPQSTIENFATEIILLIIVVCIILFLLTKCAA